MDVFRPDELLRPITGLLDEAAGALSNLSGRTLAAPLYAQVDELVARLEALSPGRLLDPLQGPYNQMMAAVAQTSSEAKERMADFLAGRATKVGEA